ncbi:MAG: trimeric autotransporter adhesin, partial [Patescibacteria group bacterium]|nr:trimeric autotransporter adhesin [Patescibacteria group bacterium]
MKGVRIGAGFCVSVAMAYYGASYAAATWGNLPNATSGTAVSSTAWNDIVAQLNGLAGAISVSSGNVGVGTASPIAKLDIFKKFNSPFNPADASLVIGDSTNYSTSSDSNINGSIMFRGNSATHGFLTYQPNQLSTRGLFRITGYGGAYNSHPVDFSVSGNVGIGTLAPGQKLTIEDGNMEVRNWTNNRPRIYMAVRSGVGGYLETNDVGCSGPTTVQVAQNSARYLCF